MVANHYRWDFIGLSTDVKPTPATSEKVVDGSTFYCSDNSKLYVYCKNNWYEKTVSGGGEPYVLPIASDETLGGIKVGSNLTIDSETGVLDATDTTYTAGTGISISENNEISATGGGGGDVTELTAEDYDYHATGSTDNTIALWRLSQGIYKFGDEVSVSPIASTTGRNARGGGYAIISGAWTSAGVNYKNIIFNARNGKAYMWIVNADNGSEVTSTAQLADNEIITEDVIAKNYLLSYADVRYIPTLGYIKDAFIKSKNGAPDTGDLGKQGTLCVNYATATPELYVQTSATSPMNWVKVV